LKKILWTLALVSSSVLADGHGPHWGYAGAESAENWGKLSPEFGLCSTGKNQSPIDVNNTIDSKLAPISFKYQANANEVINNGHTIQVNVAAGSDMVFNGNTYHLKQFHFHAPSENLIDGKSYPFEAHLVHADDKGNLAVIGVMFKIGEANKTITDIWAKMPDKADGKNPLDVAINAMSLLPKQRSYYRFNGSLTTPPCTEGVTWILMKHPVTISQEQVDQFSKVMGVANNRPVQPVNARPVLK
jgi:carbonic anhydrase